MPPRARALRATVCLAALLAGSLPVAASAQTQNYEDAYLAGANFENASLQNVNFQNANLQRADLQGADLRGANLRGANLRSANLESASLQGANLQGAILQSASLQQANSQDTIFQNANLQGANLQSALLYGADLRGANLREANLFGANLQTANLQNANLVDTNLAATNLLNANMQGAIRFASKKLSTAPVVLKAPAVKRVAIKPQSIVRKVSVKSPATAKGAPVVKHIAVASAPAPTATPVNVAPSVPLPTPMPAASPALLGERSAPTPTPSPSSNPGPTLIRLSADRVQFFYDRFLVEADGNVHVRTSDGMVMSGDAFSMDLKLNRFLLAGHVHMQNPSGSQDGAAVADFLEFNRIYFVPLTRESQSATGIPDRWTFIDGDFADPAKGREMPGDTFYFPDLDNAKPYIIATSAVIGSHSFVRFGGGRFDAGEGLGAYVPVPSYYVNFSADQHLGDNSLAGANYDATWEFAGNANAISALHFRYDTVNKTYMAFEQHMSGKKGYAVFSLNPMTRPSKFWSLLLSDRPSDRTQIRSFTQLHTFQFGLRSPLESQQVTTIQATQALSGSFLQASYQFENFSLLPLGCYQGHCTVPDHPSSVQLMGQTFDRPLTHYFQGARIYGHLNYGFGFQHNSLGLQSVGGVNYTTIWQRQLGFGLYMPDLKFGSDLNIPTKYYALNASFDKQRQWNSTPHYTDTTQSKISLSKILDNHVLAYLDYSVENVADIYSGGLQSTIYPSFTPVINGISYPGYQAFHGVATFRTLSLGLNYSNGGNVAFNLLLRKHTDFPTPIPFFFQFAQPDLLGNSAVQNYLGQPPYDVTADLRLRINQHMSIDIQRSYYFNYSNLRWSPNFVFQVLQ
ncbi:MAG TPA: pentapeptide repeat-containing protein [Candidatus Rubrimentiphilum sp.]|nr:pentapeptide repeat-containing protein [Candidatus Rubrimentiphilum sp.]